MEDNASIDYPKLRRNKEMETKLNYEKRTEKTPVDASLIYCSVRENISSTNLDNLRNTQDNSKSSFHWGSEYNLNESSASMSGRIFVLSYSGKPLTPCKPQKAKKLLLGGVAKVVWNKFGEFGIKMLIPTREFTPKTILGIDNGTKFEGLSLIVGNENQLKILPFEKREESEKRISKSINKINWLSHNFKTKEVCNSSND